MLAGDGLPVMVSIEMQAAGYERVLAYQKAAPIWLPHWPVWR